MIDLRKHSVDDNGARSCKEHEVPPEGMEEDVDDRGRGVREWINIWSIWRFVLSGYSAIQREDKEIDRYIETIPLA